MTFSMYQPRFRRGYAVNYLRKWRILTFPRKPLIGLSEDKPNAIDDKSVVPYRQCSADRVVLKVGSRSGALTIRRFGLSRFREGFVKIRHFGLLANRNRRQALASALRSPCVSQSLAYDHHSYPASIRTLKEPHGARCTLGFDLKPGSGTTATGPGWLGAAIWLAISRDLAITRSHPNKASGCRCCKLFR
jgi:hypothetical protein